MILCAALSQNITAIGIITDVGIIALVQLVRINKIIM